MSNIFNDHSIHEQERWTHDQIGSHRIEKRRGVCEEVGNIIENLSRVALAPLISLHEMDDTISLEVIIIIDTKHEGSEVGNVKFEFLGLIEVGSIGNKDADMKVLGELNYVVTATIR